MSTQSPRNSSLKVAVVASVVTFALMFLFCPKQKERRPFLSLLSWMGRIAPVVVPFFFEPPQANYEISQHMLANSEPELIVGGSGEPIINHGHEW